MVSVLIEQPKSGSAQAMDGLKIGHAMIGIEYSRKSAISNRYERYKLQYGFYPAGGTNHMGSGMVMMRHNTVIPGQLNDDYDHFYDVSRSYPAKPEQVNAILQASEKYAEGGYGLYDRNCTTFVKEMVVNTAHLATGGEVFKQSEVPFSHFANFAMFGSEAVNQNAKAKSENILMDLAQKNDESYQNYGNKRATKRDFVFRPADIEHRFDQFGKTEVIVFDDVTQAGVQIHRAENFFIVNAHGCKILIKKSAKQKRPAA